MNCRRHGSKPTFALWMLVAVADVAVLAAAAGLLTVVLVVAALLTAAGAVLAVRLSHRHDIVVRLARLQHRNSAAHRWSLRRGTSSAAHHWLVRPVPVRRPGQVTPATVARRRA
jgi:small-conductance mechanosensitive channel